MPNAPPISPTTPLIPNGGSFPLQPSSSPILSSSPSPSSTIPYHFAESTPFFSISDLPPLRSLSRSSSFTIDFLDESGCKASNDEQALSQELVTSTGSEDNVTASESNSVSSSRANSVGTRASDNSSREAVLMMESIVPCSFSLSLSLSLFFPFCSISLDAKPFLSLPRTLLFLCSVSFPFPSQSPDTLCVAIVSSLRPSSLFRCSYVRKRPSRTGYETTSIIGSVP